MDKRRILNTNRFFKVKKLRAIRYKGGKCQKCGYDKCISALEFHHRDPNEKEFEWGRLRGRKWEDVLKELDKCDLLCANCHREEHHDDAIWYEAEQWGLLTEEEKRKLVPDHGKRLKAKEKKERQSAKCETCGADFIKHTSKSRFCSLACSNKARDSTTKIDWPENLPELVKQSSMRAIARQLGVSDKAVKKRLRKHH